MNERFIQDFFHLIMYCEMDRWLNTWAVIEGYMPIEWMYF